MIDPELFKKLKEVFDRRRATQSCGNCRMGDVESYLRREYPKDEADRIYREFSTSVLGFVA